MKNTILFIFFLLTAKSLSGQDTYSKGCVLDPEIYKTVKAISKPTTRSFENLPTFYSLKQYTAIPGNQGSMQGSCTGWATTYAARTILESIFLNRTNQDESKSEGFSPSFIYNRIKVDPYSCIKGSVISQALDLLKNEGCLKLKDFNYISSDCSKIPNNEEIRKAGSYKIKDFIRLSGYNIDKNDMVNNIKKALVNKNPVAIGFTCYSSFNNAKEVYNVISESKFPGWHAVCIIGYDDSKFGGAFEIMNSWGSSWGNKGYTFMRYSDIINDNYFQAYQVIGDFKEDPTPVYNAFSGTVKLVKDNGEEFKPILSKNVKRDFEIISTESPTYKIANATNSGDKFRVLFNTNKASYVYLISYGTATKIAKPIFPFENFSALLNANSEIAIPNENYYIQLDKNIGTDYLTILYSKDILDINEVCKQINLKTGSFIQRLNDMLGKNITGNEIKFNEAKISFETDYTRSKLLPIVIEFQHK